MAGARYCTREQVTMAFDAGHSRRFNAMVDRLIESASRQVDRLCRRVFYPRVATRYFDWPDYGYPGGASWRVWLDEHELISVTSLANGGNTLVEGTDFYLEPVNDGPPYRSIEIIRSSSAAFTWASGGSEQRAIAVTGVWGVLEDTEQVSTVSGTLSASHATFTISPEQVGVGDTLKIDDEYVLLTDVSLADTAQDLQANLSASTGDVSVSVEDGTGFAVDEVIAIGSESMRVTAISGNTLTVKRAHQGSVLAAHSSGADVYAERAFTAERGVYGSTAASHTDGTAVYVLRWPPLVRELAAAEAIVRIQDERTGYARPVTGFNKQAMATPTGLEGLRNDVLEAHGRHPRARAI